MLIYHHTSRRAFDNIVAVGRVLPALCRDMYHPRLSMLRNTVIHRPALWALPEPFPEKWVKFESDRLNFSELMWHTHNGRPPAILAIDVIQGEDVWIADWFARLQDKALEDDAGLFEYPRYYGSMRPYDPQMDISDFVLPEIICFGEIRAHQIKIVPEADIDRPSFTPRPLSSETSGFQIR